MKIFSSILIVFFFSIHSFAIEIVQTKGNKVLLDLEGENATVDQKLYLLNAAGKKIALATILQSKNGRAIAIINKGKTDGAKTVALINSPMSANTPTSKNLSAGPVSTKGLYRLNGIKYSGLLTLSMNSMNTKQSDGTQPVPNQEDVALSGQSFGVTGAIDYPYKDLLILRGTLGYEPFQVSGNSRFLSCNNLTSNSCTASIQYLSTGGYLRFNLTKSQYQIWLGAGGTGKFPISKSTTALREDDIKFTITVALAGGVDYFISNKNFIPLSFEYQLFQNSDTVSANIIMLRGGYGWSF